MKKNSLEEMLSFFEKIGGLKKIRRTGWVKRKVRDPEHVSDHAFRVSVMAMMFAKALKCNQLKLIKLALVHDLQEAVCGDLILDYSKYNSNAKGLSEKEKAEKEKGALEELCSLLDKKTAKEFRKLWIEADEGNTREAIIVRELDKLEMLLQASEYERENNGLRPLFSQFLDANGKFIKEPSLKRILEKITEKTTKSKN